MHRRDFPSPSIQKCSEPSDIRCYTRIFTQLPFYLWCVERYQVTLSFPVVARLAMFLARWEVSTWFLQVRNSALGVLFRAMTSLNHQCNKSTYEKCNSRKLCLARFVVIRCTKNMSVASEAVQNVRRVVVGNRYCGDEKRIIKNIVDSELSAYGCTPDHPGDAPLHLTQDEVSFTNAYADAYEYTLGTQSQSQR